MNVCSRFTISPTSRGSWDLSLESNLIFKVTILDERQSTRNLSLRRLIRFTISWTTSRGSRDLSLESKLIFKVTVEEEQWTRDLSQSKGNNSSKKIEDPIINNVAEHSANEMPGVRTVKINQITKSTPMSLKDLPKRRFRVMNLHYLSKRKERYKEKRNKKEEKGDKKETKRKEREGKDRERVMELSS